MDGRHVFIRAGDRRSVKTVNRFARAGLNVRVKEKRICFAKKCERVLNVANVITGIRVVCALALIFCPTFSTRFYALYIPGGISDLLDGIVARRFGKETKFGARPDTVADIVFAAVVIIKTVRAIYIPAWLIVWIICIAVIKCANMISGFVIHKRFISEHTVINKICGVLLFAIPICIGQLPRRPVAILIVLTCGAATVAAVQEGHYIRTGKEIR